jgi:UDP-N-acetylglucosamine:LPS N-acetylglucosamine transferase
MEKQPKYVARIDNVYFINRVGISLRAATSNLTTEELPENIRLLLRRLKRMEDRANSRKAD